MSSLSTTTTTADADSKSSNNNNNTPSTIVASIRKHRLLLDHMRRTRVQLQSDHRTRILHASLARDAAYVWECNDSHRMMTTRQRQDPDLILKSITSAKIPHCMEWKNFDSYFGIAIRKDATLLLARLEHVPGFEQVSRRFANGTP